MYTKKIISVLLFSSLTAAFGTSASGQPAPASDTATLAPAVDNTKINQRDKAPDTLKATDQPNSSADVKVAADARRAIVDDKSLSITAHNVKLVAAGGVITLRGPVNSSDEKAKVGQIVASVRGVSSVDNQLDVKTQ
jgi:hyperosmotically inducible protein